MIRVLINTPVGLMQYSLVRRDGELMWGVADPAGWDESKLPVLRIGLIRKIKLRVIEDWEYWQVATRKLSWWKKCLLYPPYLISFYPFLIFTGPIYFRLIPFQPSDLDRLLHDQSVHQESAVRVGEE